MVEGAVPDRLRVVREGVGAGGAWAKSQIFTVLSPEAVASRPAGWKSTPEIISMTFAAHDQVAVRHGPELPGGIIRNMRETDVVATQSPAATRTLMRPRRRRRGATDRDDAIDRESEKLASETDAEIRTRIGLCGWNAAADTALTWPLNVRRN